MVVATMPLRVVSSLELTVEEVVVIVNATAMLTVPTAVGAKVGAPDGEGVPPQFKASV